MLKIPEQYKSLEYRSPITWADIFGEWRKGEAEQESWRQHWEERGFSSWDEWREIYAAPLNPENLEWSLYDIADPLKDLPNFYGTPTRGWVDKAYGGEITKQLKDIIKLPIIADNPKILDIKKDFPEKTMLAGLIYEDKIVLIEGMHRAAALASWSSSTPLNSNVKIALTEWKQSELLVLGGNVKKKN